MSASPTRSASSEPISIRRATPAARSATSSSASTAADDATLVALAEERGLKRIFTLDSDFGIYRLGGRGSFELVPE